jgi:hypothetical protein
MSYMQQIYAGLQDIFQYDEIRLHMCFGARINSSNKVTHSAWIPDSVSIQMLAAYTKISFQMQYQILHNKHVGKINHV